MKKKSDFKKCQTVKFKANLAHFVATSGTGGKSLRASSPSVYRANGRVLKASQKPFCRNGNKAADQCPLRPIGYVERRRPLNHGERFVEINQTMGRQTKHKQVGH